jgi:uncharacterized protein
MAWEILLQMLLEASPYIVLSLLIAGAIHQWMPKSLLKKHLGSKGQMPLLKAVGIGGVVPICSCGTIPLGIGLYRCGAAAGTVLCFMTSSPVLSPVVVLLSYKMLGAKLATALLVTALLGSYLIGLFGNKILKEPVVASDEALELDEDEKSEVSGSSFKRWLHWSFIELGSSVSVELVIGLGFATVLLSMLPMDFISTWLGKQELATLIYVVIIGIPVYACSVPSVPIVHGFLLLGASPGAAVAYMIAGPATNLGELNAIRKGISKKAAIYYASALVVISLVAGLAVDHLFFPNYQYQAGFVKGKLVVEQCCIPLIFEKSDAYAASFAHISYLQWSTGALLSLLILIGLVRKINGFLKKSSTATF